MSEKKELSELAQRTLRELLEVWLAFEVSLVEVPIVKKLIDGRLTVEDYRRLLLNLRPQVVEGARWISRTASSLDVNFLGERSLVIGHAEEEHRDYEMLERDFEAAGGDREEIRAAKKNLGGEALHGYMMHQASQTNPVHMIGAMFIIEGLGEKMASDWALKIRESTGLGEDATRFLGYHGENDEDHMEKLHEMLGTAVVTEEISRRVVRTAQVVGRLYRLQLEEVGHV